MHDKYEEQQNKHYLASVLISLGASLLLSFTILLVFAALISRGVLSPWGMVPATGTACLAGAFVMGVRGVKMMKTRALASGVLFGFGYFLVLLVLGSLFFVRLIPSEPMLYMPLTGLGGGLAAGILGAFNKKPPPAR
jgi:putative membrane protein (TIGR04086 family)